MASPLRKWLKKQDVYDPDLESSLQSQNINEPSDFASVTESQWSEIWRICVVERAKDLKDQKSKLRLEKKMKKVEKLWRKESGIKSTSISAAQKKQKKSKSKPKSPNTNALQKASDLKKYLQKNDCFDKDLVQILCNNYAIYSENDLSKIDSNQSYDNILREMRVLRAKELKDNSAQLRLQKLMSKFEKLWRKQSGISKKTSQTQKTKQNGSNYNKSEDSTVGKELKNWMKKNKIWEIALFDALIANGIRSEDELQSLSESQFDTIVRKVRVDRFSQLKDQNSRNRADKLLVAFEKQWRNKVKAKKGAESAKAEKEEIMPWYLSGISKNSKNSALASKSRTTHQKKKDNKINDALRKSSAIEQEWIEIYSLRKYGKYIAPKVDENKYGKKRKSANESEEKKSESESEIDDQKTPDLHAMTVDFEEIVVDVCIEMLLTLHESWEGRVSILKALVAQLCAPQISDDVYALKLCKFLCAIGHQFSDPRSLIIQAMEECMTKLITETPQKFVTFAPYILQSLFTTFPVRIEALRDPGVKLGAFLIAQLKTDRALISCVFEGLNSKHKEVRTECAMYCGTIIGAIESEESDDNKEFLSEIDSAVRKACKDAASEARMNGYRALLRYKSIAPNAAQEIIDKMTKAQLTKYEEAIAGL